MTGPQQDAQPRDGEALAHAVMVLAALIFGINYVVGRWATGEVPAYTLGFVRWTCGALILLPFAWRRIAADRAWIGRNWKLLALAGFLMPFMGAGLTYVALNHTLAVNGGVLQTSLPVFTVIFAWLVLRERTAAAQWAGAAIAIAGVLYVVSRGRIDVLLGLTFNAGDALLIVCNMGLAGYAVAVRRMSPGYHPLTLLTLICAVGAAIHAPFFAVETVTAEPIRPSFKAVASLAFVAVFPSVIAIMCWNYALGRLGASRAGFYMYLVPVFGAALAVPVLGEEIGLHHLGGAVLIVAGVTVSSRRPRRAG